jgi:hypothetical protein
MSMMETDRQKLFEDTSARFRAVLLRRDFGFVDYRTFLVGAALATSLGRMKLHAKSQGDDRLSVGRGPNDGFCPGLALRSRRACEQEHGNKRAAETMMHDIRPCEPQRRRASTRHSIFGHEPQYSYQVMDCAAAKEKSDSIVQCGPYLTDVVHK